MGGNKLLIELVEDGLTTNGPNDMVYIQQIEGYSIPQEDEISRIEMIKKILDLNVVINSKSTTMSDATFMCTSNMSLCNLRKQCRALGKTQHQGNYPKQNYSLTMSSSEGEVQSKIRRIKKRIALIPIKLSNPFDSLNRRVGSPVLGNH